jgi:hypothetical protein
MGADMGGQVCSQSGFRTRATAARPAMANEATGMGAVYRSLATFWVAALLQRMLGRRKFFAALLLLLSLLSVLCRALFLPTPAVACFSEFL